MKKIIAAMDFTLQDKKFIKGKEVKVNSKEELIRLNERGFIEPFSMQEIEECFKDNKKESENNGSN